ncbi:MAG: glycosyltransferase [Candidatus Microsaccharimonas sp.]
MNIALVTDYYLPTLGGVQTAIKAHKEALEDAGHKVTVFCPLHEESDNASIVRLPTSTRFRPDNYPFTWSPSQTMDVLRAEFAVRDIQVVHIHTEMIAAVSAVIVAREMNLPIVQTMHGRIDVYSKNVLPLASVTSIPLTRIHNRYINHSDARVNNEYYYTKTATARRMWRLMVSQANSADYVIVPSHHFADKLISQGVDKPHAVLSNGIENSVLTTIGKAPLRLYHRGETLKVMWCGRVSPEKRPLAFVKAMQLLPDTITADIYGDGVWLKKIRRYIIKNGLQDRVVAHGGVSQKEVLDAMKTHHVFLSSSFNFDNQPMVLLEAMSTGMPIVYSDPDLSEMLPVGGALLTQSPEPLGIAATLQSILDTPNVIKKMSKITGAHRLETKQEAHTRQLISIYTSLRR